MVVSPKVSVCMITYGHEKYIREAIDGVFMQETNFEIELIIADDASPDGTKEIIASICKNHPKGNSIKYFRQDSNIGMMPNFVFALTKSEGEYVAVCEGDDYWIDSLKLQKQVDFLDAHKSYSSCFTDVKILKNKITSETGALKEKHKKDSDAISVFYNLWIPTLTFVYRRSALLEFPPQFKKVNNGDLFLFYLLAQKGAIKYLDFISGVYRQHENGVWTGASKLSQINKSLVTLKEVKDYFKANIKIKKIIEQKIKEQNISVLKYYYKQGKKSKFAKMFLKNVLHHPLILLDKKLYFFINKKRNEA